MELREELLGLLEENCPGVDFKSSAALVDDGLLDSLDIVMIVGEMADRFDVEITADEIVPENFNSVDAMCALIKALREGDL